MKDLIEALTIFAKYHNARSPTVCEHDVLYIVGVGQDVLEIEEVRRLNELGFFWSVTEEGWYSHRFGSA